MFFPKTMLERDGATKNPSGWTGSKAHVRRLLTTTRANAGVSCSACGRAFWLPRFQIADFGFWMADDNPKSKIQNPKCEGLQ
jgi:hypothetical protein